MYCMKSHIHFQVSPSTSEIFSKYLKSGIFTPVYPMHTNTHSQSSKTLFVPLWNINQGKRTFHYRGAKIWNKLSPNVCFNYHDYDSMNMHMFKNDNCLMFLYQ